MAVPALSSACYCSWPSLSSCRVVGRAWSWRCNGCGYHVAKMDGPSPTGPRPLAPCCREWCPYRISHYTSRTKPTQSFPLLITTYKLIFTYYLWTPGFLSRTKKPKLPGLIPSCLIPWSGLASRFVLACRLFVSGWHVSLWLVIQSALKGQPLIPHFGLFFKCSWEK